MYFIMFFIFLCVVSTFCHILHFIYYFDFSRRALRQYRPQFLATKSGRVWYLYAQKKKQRGRPLLLKLGKNLIYKNLGVSYLYSLHFLY